MSDKERLLRALSSFSKRMSWGSALLEVWSVSCVAGLLLLASQPAQARWGWLALFLAICFWILDAYLLRQRTLFREAHARVKELAESEVSRSQGTTPLVDTETASFSAALFSPWIAAFHGAVIGCVLVVRWIRPLTGQ